MQKATQYKLSDWLPVSKEELDKRGWDYVDVIIVSGDAYVDHPSFGHAMIARLLEKEGLRVAILPQPNWRDDLRDFKKLGKPRLFFGVTAGCMDSMVNHYTAFKRLRSNDAYTPGDKAGFRPDYASVVYSNILKRLHPDVPVVLGGVEASLRRLTHYDYWSDTLKPSILIDSGADLLVYGQGISPLKELIKHLQNGGSIDTAHEIRQIAYVVKPDKLADDKNSILLPSHEDCLKDNSKFAESYCTIETESNKMHAKRLLQLCGDRYVVVNPQYLPMSTAELDSAYDLPYTRMPHPRYMKRGSIPAYEMIRHSINTHTGCFGGCSFCSISMHQGKFVASRSEKSILLEAGKMNAMPDFKGNLSDLGGPSANMYQMQGTNLEMCEKCARYSCIHPKICPNLNDNHGPIIDIYKKVSAVKGIKKLFIGSGLRYDLFIGRTPVEDKEKHLTEYFTLLVEKHVSGRLKVAPEHTVGKVLAIMRKPSYALYKQLQEQFYKISQKAGLRQQLIPYFISSHPGCTLADMAECALETKNAGLQLEQVQDLTPTPMTLASVMYYTETDPYSGKKLSIAKKINEKREQKMLFFWYLKENRQEIIHILKKSGLSQYIS
ncbi:MAG TPA: YgiQ family radical SAM protein, partial [Bacteroidales bacterium]|nr:YgiQ family radical SAM protein [Bacteroidales bacterium]